VLQKFKEGARAPPSSSSGRLHCTSSVTPPRSPHAAISYSTHPGARDWPKKRAEKMKQKDAITEGRPQTGGSEAGDSCGGRKSQAFFLAFLDPGPTCAPCGHRERWIGREGSNSQKVMSEGRARWRRCALKSHSAARRARALSLVSICIHVFPRDTARGLVDCNKSEQKILLISKFTSTRRQWGPHSNDGSVLARRSRGSSCSLIEVSAPLFLARAVSCIRCCSSPPHFPIPAVH
jgi:hypothetical protein